MADKLDIAGYFQRSKIPPEVIDNYAVLVSEFIEIRSFGDAWNMITKSFDLGFARGWRARRAYDKRQAASRSIEEVSR